MIGRGTCHITGYEKQSLRCANCRYNRVKYPHLFLNAANTENNTAGSYCIADEGTTAINK